MHVNDSTGRSNPPTRSNKKPDIYYPTLSIARSVTVYRPAVPIRAVSVVVDEDGMTTHEETVLGIQIVTADRYDGMAVPITNGRVGRVPIPKTLSHDDIESAGFRPDVIQAGYTTHDLIIWSSEYGCPIALTEHEKIGTNFEIISGPATNPECWWNSLIEDTVANIRRRLARSKAAQGGTA